MNVIDMRNINKNYYEGQENELHILHDVCMTVVRCAGRRVRFGKKYHDEYHGRPGQAVIGRVLLQRK